ncbi:replication protein A 70 kDa DNA-binding subunit B-like [Rutidosis leptorrhynchoides]|uniref:replication protein A 70 kDa DNA-binding subunit B-like n=1 Tax=Rutidosis leptorrhynchoides TaxID=125765 RepID=UPI003A9A407E
MTQITALAQLIPGDIDRTIAARIYRKWVTYSYHNQAPTGYCCMLIDEMVFVFYISADIDKAYFDELMNLNKMYVITNFSAHAITRWEKILPGPMTFLFDRNTDFEELPFADYPDHYFQFVAYNQLRTRVPNTTVLAVSHTFVYIGDTIQLTLWNELATSFDSDAYDAMEKPVVLAVSSCRPKLYLGELQLGCTQSSCALLRKPTIAHQPIAITGHGNRTVSQQIFPARTSDPQLEQLHGRLATNVDFTCEGTIEQVGGNRDWYYKSCSECLLKVTEDIDAPNNYTCWVHGTKATYTPTYCFKTIINDTSNNASFTFFSEAGDVIVGTTCSDLITNRGYDQPHELPPIIRAIEGQTHTFQFHYNPQSRKTHPEFIVTRILDEIPNVVTNTDAPTQNSRTWQQHASIDCPVTDARAAKERETRKKGVQRRRLNELYSPKSPRRVTHGEGKIAAEFKPDHRRGSGHNGQFLLVWRLEACKPHYLVLLCKTFLEVH